MNLITVSTSNSPFQNVSTSTYEIVADTLNGFLLQSRVVQQAEGERSYHVFYQLCAGADALLRGI